MKKTKQEKIRVVCGSSFLKIYDIDDDRRDKKKITSFLRYAIS